MFSGGLKKGDVIGIASPSHIATHEDYDPIFRAIEAMGLGWKAADHLFDADWGYANSDENRAADLNQLICDDQVKMIFFGGGEGGDEIIPLIDYQAAREHPKIWMGFSDGTSVLSAIRHRAGQTVYYGQSPSNLLDESEYNRRQFAAHILQGKPGCHEKSGPWRTLVPGKARGVLSGGYLENYTWLSNAGWILPEEGKEYILVLEEHRMFFGPEHFSDEIGRLEQAPIFRQAKGVLFGLYADGPAAWHSRGLLRGFRARKEQRHFPAGSHGGAGYPGRNAAIFLRIKKDGAKPSRMNYENFLGRRGLS